MSFNSITKVFFWVLIFLILSFLSFYFWGASSWYDQSAYYEITAIEKSSYNKDDTFRIATYNIGYLSGMTNNKAVPRDEDLFHKNLDRSVEILSDLDLDILALQEIDFSSNRSYYYNQYDSLLSKLNFNNGAKAINWDKSYVPFPYWPINYHFGKMLSGQAVLSKIQIVDLEVVVLSKPVNAPFYYNKFYLDRLIQTAYLSLNGKDTLMLMNVHLEAFDFETRLLQTQFVASEFQRFSEKYPIILCGDFNSSPPFGSQKTNSSLSIIYEIPGIKEAISKQDYLYNEERHFTFNSENPKERLDYIFYTGESIQKIDANIVSESGQVSDHLPVRMTFKLK